MAQSQSVYPSEMARGKTWTIAMVLMLAVAACRESDETTVIVEQVVVAEAGYSVPRPEGFDVKVTGPEVRLTESGNLRSPRALRVRPVGPGAVLDGEVRTRAGTAYVVAEMGAGSGGVVWQLTALRSVGGAAVEVTALVQTEAAGVPTFAWAWSVIDGIAPQQ